MSERHDIDKLAREGTSQPPPFAYKEEYWDKAAGMLDQGAATGIRKWFGLGLLLLIGIGGAGLTYFLIQPDDGQTEGKPARQHVLASSTIEINLAVATQQATLVPSNEAIGGSTTESQFNEKGDQQLQNEAINQPSQAEAGNTTSVGRTSEKELDRNDAMGSTESGSIETKLSVEAGQETTEKGQELEEDNRASETIQDETKGEDLSLGSSKAVEESVGQAPAEEIGRNVSSEGSTSAKTPAVPLKPALSWFTLDQLNTDHIANGEVQLPPIHSDYDPDEALRKKYQGAKWEFWIQVGTRITTTWDSSSRLSLDPVIGVGVSYDLSPRVQVSSGISAFTRSGESLPKNYTVRHYSFGVEYKHYGQVLNHVYYVQLPLSLHYRFHPRHQLGVGGNLNYVITTKNSASNNWPAEVAVNVEEFEGYHYLDGLKRMNGGLDLHYNYMVNDLWSIWLQMEYGLGSGLTPEYYDTDKTGHNHGLSVGIRHYLK